MCKRAVVNTCGTRVAIVHDDGDFIAFIFQIHIYSNKNHHKPVIDQMHNNENNHISTNCTASEKKGDEFLVTAEKPLLA